MYFRPAFLGKSREPYFSELWLYVLRFCAVLSWPGISLSFVPSSYLYHAYVLMSYEHHTANKFESLRLSELWEAVAGRIDFHFSDPRCVLPSCGVPYST